MAFNFDIKIIKRLDADKYPWCNDAFLISVNKGKAALIKENYGQGPGFDYFSAITLNGKPLIQCKLSQCPTCAGMLATGYGIDKNSPELKTISDAINSDFETLEKSIENIKPLLGLLADGLYVVADIPSYPTDGNKNFFWSVSNKLKEAPATTETYFDSEDYSTIDGIPLFIYPSQSTDCFDEERVNYYLKAVPKKCAPRAIAYHIGGFISVLLDGHHKATAAAISGNLINCLTIIPITGYQINSRGEVYFSQFKVKRKLIPLLLRSKIAFQKVKNINKQITDGNIIKKQWEQKYLTSAEYFPDVNEIAASLSNEIHEITNAIIEECYSTINAENSKKLSHIITVLNRKKDVRCKEIALKCAKLKIDSPQLRSIEPQDLNRLKEVAFKVLVKIKDDKIIEQFFIDFLVDYDIKHEQLKKIADSYWDGIENEII